MDLKRKAVTHLVPLLFLYSCCQKILLSHTFLAIVAPLLRQFGLWNRLLQFIFGVFALIEAIVFGPFSSEGERCDIYGHTGEIIHMGSSEACLWTSLVDYIFECGFAFFRLVFSKRSAFPFFINFFICR